MVCYDFARRRESSSSPPPPPPPHRAVPCPSVCLSRVVLVRRRCSSCAALIARCATAARPARESNPGVLLRHNNIDSDPFAIEGKIWAGVGISTGCGRNFAKVEQKPQLAERNARFHFRKESQAGLFLLARHTSIIACFRRSGVEHSLHARAPVRHHRRERESYLRTHEALADRAGACLSRAAASSALIFFSRWRGVVWGGLPAKT